jgi:hypothetical protein
MRLKNLLVAVFLLCGSLGITQDQGGFKAPAFKPIKPISQGPVTEAEAAAAFARFEKVAQTVLKIQMQGPSLLASSPKLVSRERVVAAMGRIFDSSRRAFRYTPRRMKVDRAKIGLKQNRALGEKLVAWGFIARVSPIVAGPRDTVTIAEFGDALGLFAARLAELSHTPSMKWSPYLMPPG